VDAVTLIFIFGLCVGGLGGAFITALAAAADKPVPREDARVHLYQTTGARGVYRVHHVKPGTVTAIRGDMVTMRADDCAAFGERR
jgi:hypothetical protein